MQISIPGESKIQDNDWKMLMDGLNIQPKDDVEKLEWMTDVAAFHKSTNEFINRANQWRSYTGQERSEYTMAPSSGTQNDFVGPMAFSSSRGLFDVGIKIPNMENDADISAFCKYTRLIHEYKSAVGDLVYTENDANRKATINAALLIATVDKKLAARGIDTKKGLRYSQSDETDMAEICGLIGKKTNGEDMSAEEHKEYLSNLSDLYVSEIIGKTQTISSVKQTQTYGEYKKIKQTEQNTAVEDKINQMTAEEKDELLKRLLATERG